MDGEIIRAKREYSFADGGNTTIEASFKCVVPQQALTFKLTSFVGDPDKPSKRSAFQFESGSVPYTPDSYDANGMREIHAGDNALAALANRPQLEGRIKFNGMKPVDMGGDAYGLGGEYFLLGNFANVVNANLHLWSVAGLKTWAHQPQTANISKNFFDSINASQKFNVVAALKYVFPVVIEVRNGVGTYDLVIDESSAVDVVLDGCGGRGPVVDASLLAQLEKASSSSGGSIGETGSATKRQ
jgi:hypothetical protein